MLINIIARHPLFNFIHQIHTHNRETFSKTEHTSINQSTNMMQSTTCLMNKSSPIKFHPFSTSNGRKGSSLVRIVKASSSRKEAADHHHGHHENNMGGRLVDESMIVLRKRIHEMKMIERNYEAPSHWMDWEKRYYTSYDSIICEAMGVLQTQLMSTRPSLALAAFAFVAISLPTSSALFLFHFLDFTKALLAAIHISS